MMDKTARSVAILGAGRVGTALGARLVHAGVDVRFGVREPGATNNLVAGRVAHIPLMYPSDAVVGAGIVFLAVPAAAALEAAERAGDMVGKILVDCSNPVHWDNGPVWAPPAAGSVAEALAAALPGVDVVKGFNHFGVEVQADPSFPSGPADALFAGDDDSAKRRVMALAADMGFRPHDAGPLRNAALLENLGVLWIHLATVTGVGREFTFGIERRD